MSNSGSWQILFNTLKARVGAMLQILPMSALPADAQTRYNRNRATLVMLGKLAADDSQCNTKSSQEKQALHMSAEEMLQLLWQSQLSLINS